MATNLVSEIAEVLSPNIVSSIASALGLNRTATQKAVVAAVPALLAALINYVTKPQGATKLAEVAIPGIAPIIKPTVDAIRSKLDALSTASS
jgi:hypothetical protein